MEQRSYEQRILSPTGRARVRLVRQTDGEILNGWMVQMTASRLKVAILEPNVGEIGEEYIVEVHGPSVRLVLNAKLMVSGKSPAEFEVGRESRDVDLAIGILESGHRGIEAEILFHERYVAVTARGWKPRGSGAAGALTERQLAAASLAVASPTATYHESVQRMLDTMGLAERTVVHARHYAALPELDTRTDLLAIVPQMYARAIAARWPVRVWKLPGVAPQYGVQMLWHATAAREPSHAWLRALVRRLFARDGEAPASDRGPAESVGARPGRRNQSVVPGD